MPAYSLSSLSEHSTLVDLLTFRASQPGPASDDVILTFLEAGEGAGETVTLASLDRRARSIAVHLRESARPGDRILLVYVARQRLAWFLVGAEQIEPRRPGDGLVWAPQRISLAFVTDTLFLLT